MRRKTRFAAPIAVLVLAAAAAAGAAGQPAPPAPPAAAAPAAPATSMHMGHAAAPHPAAHPVGHSMAGTAAAPADVASADALVAAFYSAVSGPAGTSRDRERFVSLFFPGARLLPAEGKGHSGTMPMAFSAASYLYDTQTSMLADGFVEREIARRSEGFGKVTHVWSTYEARHAASDPQPFVRGVNSFELFFDGKRWWIASLVWQPETAALKLPADLLH